MSTTYSNNQEAMLSARAPSSSRSFKLHVQPQERTALTGHSRTIQEYGVISSRQRPRTSMTMAVSSLDALSRSSPPSRPAFAVSPSPPPLPRLFTVRRFQPFTSEDSRERSSSQNASLVGRPIYSRYHQRQWQQSNQSRSERQRYGTLPQSVVARSNSSSAPLNLRMSTASALCAPVCSMPSPYTLSSCTEDLVQTPYSPHTASLPLSSDRSQTTIPKTISSSEYIPSQSGSSQARETRVLRSEEKRFELQREQGVQAITVNNLKRKQAIEGQENSREEAETQHQVHRRTDANGRRLTEFKKPFRPWEDESSVSNGEDGTEKKLSFSEDGDELKRFQELTGTPPVPPPSRTNGKSCKGRGNKIRSQRKKCQVPNTFVFSSNPQEVGSIAPLYPAQGSVLIWDPPDDNFRWRQYSGPKETTGHSRKIKGRPATGEGETGI